MVIDAFKMLEKLVLKYSTDRAKIKFLSNNEKSKKITKEQFIPAELNAICYKKSDKWFKI